MCIRDRPSDGGCHWPGPPRLPRSLPVGRDGNAPDRGTVPLRGFAPFRIARVNSVTKAGHRAQQSWECEYAAVKGPYGPRLETAGPV